jgi:chromosome segregation ATPase
VKIDETKLQIEKLQENKSHLITKVNEMKKYKEFLEHIKGKDEDIGDIQQLLDKWSMLVKCKENLQKKNNKLLNELESKKNVIKDQTNDFSAKSMQNNNTINELDKQLNIATEQTQNLTS